jgi:hypothetical protein
LLLGSSLTNWRTEQTLKTENRSEAERDRDFDTARATAAYNALEARISKRTNNVITVIYIFIFNFIDNIFF